MRYRLILFALWCIIKVDYLYLIASRLQHEEWGWLWITYQLNNYQKNGGFQKEEFKHISEGITDFLEQARNIILQNDYTNFEEAISTANHLINSLAQLKRAELKRIQGQTGSLKVSMVYLTMIQEAQNVVAYTSNLLKVSRKFQVEE